MATFNASQLRNKENKSDTDDLVGKTATFKAHALCVTITDAETGETVLETTMEPRGFKAKKDGRSGKIQGGVGWYASVTGENCGEYGPESMPVSAGLRISLDGIKVSPTDTVNLLPEGEGE